MWFEAEKFDDNINLLINSHGYQILHIGSESTCSDGYVYHHTVAVLGLPGS